MSFLRWLLGAVPCYFPGFLEAAAMERVAFTGEVGKPIFLILQYALGSPMTHRYHLSVKVLGGLTNLGDLSDALKSGAVNLANLPHSALQVCIPASQYHPANNPCIVIDL